MTKKEATTLRKPLAVVISDVHYSLNTYQLANQAFLAAIEKAAQLGVPLIDCGDLTNDKAILRAEVVNTLINTMEYARDRNVPLYLLVGNHSLINEKGKDHALHFLHPYATVVSHPTAVAGFNFIPYQTSSIQFIAAIQEFPKGSTVFGHQGTRGGQLGHYVKDPSAFDPEQVKDWRVFLGHYHSHYELGTTVSIGNPYTLTFGEASTAPKGFLIVYEDGSYTREILPLRKHVVVEVTVDNIRHELQTEAGSFEPGNPDDLIWIKVRGTHSELSALKKSEVAKVLGRTNFKMDKIYIDAPVLQSKTETMSDTQILDAVIDAEQEGPEEKAALKALAREVLS